MRVVLQRVSRAQVRVDDAIVGKIDQGFMLLVGIAVGDTEAQLQWMATKIAGLRLFEDPAGKMNLDLADVSGRILAISQFTLLGDARKGRRPSFIGAAPPEIAAPLFDRFVALLQAATGSPIETGVFGAHMEVDLLNDGPVTLVLERAADAE